jgi:hypothetical protein
MEASLHPINTTKMKNPMALIEDNTNHLPYIDSQAIIETHKTTASHLLAAATHHFKAANYLKQGSYEKAAESAMLAKEYLNMASEAKREDMKQSSSNNETTI